VFIPIFVLPFGLKNPMAIVGVALAYSLAQYVNVAHGWYRLSHEDGNPGRGLFSYFAKLLVASGISAGVMLVISFALDLYSSTDKSHLLLFTPVSAIAGLAVLVGAVMLLNGGLHGGELKAWRSALRRSPSPGGSDVGVDPASGTDPGANAHVSDQDPIDGVDIAESEDLESTAITANLP
jgi:hypothetical protein